MKIYYTIILIFFGFLTLSIYGNNEFFYKIRQTGQSLKSFDNSWTGRAFLWTIAWERVKEEPLLGYGYGVNKRGLKDTAYSYGYKMKGLRMHNTYLKVLFELGIIGLLIYLRIVYLILFYLNKAYSNFYLIGDDRLYIYCFSLFCGWISTIFTSFFGYSSYLDKDFYILIVLALLSLYYSKIGNQAKSFA